MMKTVMTGKDIFKANSSLAPEIIQHISLDVEVEALQNATTVIPFTWQNEIT